MGKGVRDKKPNTASQRDGADNADAADVNDSIEERLRRIELAHTSSSSDVYKFAFFFIMGIVLTLVVYPGVSNTLESLKNNDDVIGVRRQFSSDKAEPIVIANDRDETVFDTRDEERLETIKDKRIKEKRETDIDRTKATSQIRANKSRQEDLLIGESEDVLPMDKNFDDLEEEPAVNDIVHETYTERSETPFARTDEATVPLKLSPVDPDSDSMTVEIEPEKIKFKRDNEPTDVSKRNSNSKKTSKQSVSKSKAKQTENKQMSKSDKSKKKVTEKKDAATSDKKKAIPKEIENFKATYLKTTKPKKVFVDGRRIPPMELLPQKPNNSSVKIWMFEEFLSDAECDGLMRVHKQHVQDQSKEDPIVCFDSIATLRKHLQHVGKGGVSVSPRDFTAGTTCMNSTFSSQLKTWLRGNWSYSTAFYPGESRFASIFENRVEEAMGLTKENGGKFQITSYPTGIGYKSHTDCMEDSTDKRDRVATVLVYLDTVKEGGETDFPELGIWARPRKGRALMWNNMDEDGNCEPMSIHQANKVVTGHKYILQRWYYYKSFYSLGKRPPEPPLPTRNPGQPRVSCDEYAHGSCRWYDEWNFEHMVEYEKQKYTLV